MRFRDSAPQRGDVAALGVDERGPFDGARTAAKRAYVIADNKIAEDAGWDKPTLAFEFQEIITEAPEFELEVTGFKTPEIDLILNPKEDSREDEADKLSVALPEHPVSREGDLWLLGPHRLLCGDATKPESYARLMAGEKAQMIFTDPPYNVRGADISGLGKARHDEFVMASGEMSESQFVAFLRSTMEQLAANSTDGSLHFICMDWRHLFELLSAARGVYRETKNLLVWKKTNGGMGSDATV